MSLICHMTWWVGVPPLNDHPARFDGDKSCESKDVTISIWNMISHCSRDQRIM